MKFGLELIRDIDRYEAKPGEYAFWWLGQLSFVVKTQNSVLYFDPFLSNPEGRVIPAPLSPDQVTNARYVLGSHDHTDHIDREIWPDIAQASPDCLFVTPDLLRPMLARELGLPLERLVGVDTGLCHRAENIAIHGVPAAHELLDTDPETGKHPYMGYVVEADGIRIYHSGDCCVYEGLESALRAFGHIDLMILPINGRDGFRLRHGCIGNMSFMEAADLAGALKPGLVIPGHYEMFEGNRFLLEAIQFAEFTEAKYPNQAFWLGAHAERVVVRASDKE